MPAPKMAWTEGNTKKSNLLKVRDITDHYSTGSGTVEQGQSENASCTVVQK